MAARAPAPPKSNSAPGSGTALPYAFGEPERLPPDQLRALESLHEDFARAVTVSLSAYLRTQTSFSDPRIGQLSFAEFSRAAGPLTTFALKMQESTAFLQLSHSALFPMIEVLLGGSGKSPAQIEREITEIERSVAGPILSIVLQELKSAWKAIGTLDFALENEAGTRQIVASMPQSQELLAIGFEIRAGESTGTLNLGLPSRPIRELLEQAFGSKEGHPADDCARMLRLIERAQVAADIRMSGPNMLLRDLLAIEAGDVLAFDHPLGKDLDLELNGAAKFTGHVVAVGNRRAFQIDYEKRREPIEGREGDYAAAGRLNSSE